MVVTQDAEDVLGSELSRAVVSNAATQILLRQAPQAIGQVAAAFRLSAGEQEFLLSARQGEGLLAASATDRVAFKTLASDYEHQLADSSPEFLLSIGDAARTSPGTGRDVAAYFGDGPAIPQPPILAQHQRSPSDLAVQEYCRQHGDRGPAARPCGTPLGRFLTQPSQIVDRIAHLLITALTHHGPAAGLALAAAKAATIAGRASLRRQHTVFAAGARTHHRARAAPGGPGRG